MADVIVPGDPSRDGRHGIPVQEQRQRQQHGEDLQQRQQQEHEHEWKQYHREQHLHQKSQQPHHQHQPLPQLQPQAQPRPGQGAPLVSTFPDCFAVFMLVNETTAEKPRQARRKRPSFLRKVMCAAGALPSQGVQRRLTPLTPAELIWHMHRITGSAGGAPTGSHGAPPEPGAWGEQRGSSFRLRDRGYVEKLVPGEGPCGVNLGHWVNECLLVQYGRRIAEDEEEDGGADGAALAHGLKLLGQELKGILQELHGHMCMRSSSMGAMNQGNRVLSSISHASCGRSDVTGESQRRGGYVSADCDELWTLESDPMTPGSDETQVDEAGLLHVAPVKTVVLQEVNLEDTVKVAYRGDVLCIFTQGNAAYAPLSGDASLDHHLDRVATSATNFYLKFYLAG